MFAHSKEYYSKGPKTSLHDKPFHNRGPLRHAYLMKHIIKPVDY